GVGEAACLGDGVEDPELVPVHSQSPARTVCVTETDSPSVPASPEAGQSIQATNTQSRAETPALSRRPSARGRGLNHSLGRRRVIRPRLASSLPPGRRGSAPLPAPPCS